eukprot:GHVU01189401.1.p2 GENE.GHVU01189401.1~~GHVU01189401.1.p2  ORF type:complete len:113 (+),score=3.78 GHVU01189401.1:1422-1760(+)
MQASKQTLFLILSVRLRCLLGLGIVVYGYGLPIAVPYSRFTNNLSSVARAPLVDCLRASTHPPMDGWMDARSGWNVNIQLGSLTTADREVERREGRKEAAPSSVPASASASQ